MDAPDAPPRSPLAPFRAGYWFGGFNGLTWMMSLGTPMVLLLEQLGASSFQVGLASSFVFLLFPVQVVATALLERFGYRRQMVGAWAVRALFLAIPFGLAWAAPEAPAAWMAWAVVASVFWFCFFRAFGVAAHVPWFAAILPEPLRGRFFATEGAITSAVGVVTLLSCSALFAGLPTWPAFRGCYGIALFGSTMATFSLTRLPAGPLPPPSPVPAMLGEARRLCLSHGLFRKYLVLALLGAVTNSSFAAFTSYYLKSEAGLASSRILLFTAAVFAGQILGAFAIRGFLDRAPIRRFFQLSYVALAGVYAYWLHAIAIGTPTLIGLAGSYFAFGVAAGVGNSAHMTFLPELSPVEKRPISIAVFGAVSGLLSGFAPMLWGLALRTGPGQPGVDMSSFPVFFAVGAVVCGIALIQIASLPDPRRRAT